MNNTIDKTSAATSKHMAPGFVARIRGMNRIFLFTVVLPTLLSATYYGFIASDVYISESRFVVRSPESQTASPLGLLLKGVGFSRSQDDSYTVKEFILSRDALQALDNQHGMRDVFASKDADIFSRFAGLDRDDSFEALYKYYKNHVDLQLDSASSIATLTTRAFTAKASFNINQQLLEMSEALINRLNERGQQDMIRFAVQEVSEAEKKSKAAALALAHYRNEKGVIDPEKQSPISLQQIAKMQDELVATNSLLAQVRMLARDNPQIQALELHAKSLENEIEAEHIRVAGGTRSLASKAVEYQRLALEKEFNDKMLASAMSTLEQARNEAMRKQFYLERIVQPSEPDVAMEPKRLRSVAAVFVIGLIAWGVLSMLVAGIMEHQD